MPKHYTLWDLERSSQAFSRCRRLLVLSKNTNSLFLFSVLNLISVIQCTILLTILIILISYFQPLFKPLIEREGTTYKKVVENLQKGLYVPHTITAKALRLFTNIPSVYYKCKAISSSSETTKGKKEVKTFKLHATWPVTSDQDVPDLKQHLEYFNNGHDYIIAIKPQVLCEVNKSKNNLIKMLIASHKLSKNFKKT